MHLKKNGSWVYETNSLYYLLRRKDLRIWKPFTKIPTPWLLIVNTVAVSVIFLVRHQQLAEESLLQNLLNYNSSLQMKVLQQPLSKTLDFENYKTSSIKWSHSPQTGNNRMVLSKPLVDLVTLVREDLRMGTVATLGCDKPPLELLLPGQPTPAKTAVVEFLYWWHCGILMTDVEEKSCELFYFLTWSSSSHAMKGMGNSGFLFVFSSFYKGQRRKMKTLWISSNTFSRQNYRNLFIEIIFQALKPSLPNQHSPANEELLQVSRVVTGAQRYTLSTHVKNPCLLVC